MYLEIIEGLRFLSTLEKTGNSCGVSADHDVIWAGPDFEDAKTGEINIPDGTLDQMIKLGWHFDEDVNRFAYFV